MLFLGRKHVKLRCTVDTFHVNQSCNWRLLTVCRHSTCCYNVHPRRLRQCGNPLPL